MTDPVVEEVRARGRALTARYGNDVGVLLRLLTERAQAHPEDVVDTVRIVRATDAPADQRRR
jgi:hypothetical protein